MNKTIVDYLQSLRPVRNSLGKIAPPKAPIEYITEEAYDEVVEWIGPSNPGEEWLTSLSMSELGDRIVLKLIEREILDD